MSPDSGDPAVWHRVLDELEAERDRLLCWHAEAEIDGLPATIRRALDVALGRRGPVFVELPGGGVLELGGDGG